MWTARAFTSELCLGLRVQGSVFGVEVVRVVEGSTPTSTTSSRPASTWTASAFMSERRLGVYVAHLRVATGFRYRVSGKLEVLGFMFRVQGSG